MKQLVILISVVLLSVGCRSIDAAAKHSGRAPQCEIHSTQMSPEWIRVSPGEAVYVLAYIDVAKKRFPNHGSTILSGEREYRAEFTRRVRDFVCPKCTEAYHAY